MKKALAMALGAMLVAGSAAPAAAASQIDFSGYYRAYFLNDWNYNHGGRTYDGVNLDSGKQNDSRFVNRLNLDFGFHATDEVSVYWRLRAPAAQRWGSDDSTAAVTRYIYGEVVQDWGTVSIGRLADSFVNLGLADLGYAPDGLDGAFTAVLPFDLDAPADGIRWANRWDNGFQLVAQFNRLSTSNSFTYGDMDPVYDQNGLNIIGYIPVEKTGTVGDEQTSDLYTVEGAYFWDGGGAALGLSYLRDHAGFLPYQGGVNEPALKMFFVNPAIAHSWDNGFSLHFEGKMGWGKVEEPGDESIDARGYAFYLDGDYNYGPGNVTLAGWWASGTKETDDKINSAVDFGAFRPLLIAYGNNVTQASRKGNGTITNAVGEANVVSGDGTMANHWAIDLNGRHAFTDDITFTWALAYLALNKTQEGASKSIGFETDLGLQFQLLDNLKFSTDVGYLFSGNAFDVRGEDPLTGDPYTAKPKDRVAWYNSLTFSF